MKKILAKALSVVLASTLLLSGCATSGKKNDAFNIGIIQIVDHPALNASRDGFIKALEDKGYKNGEKINLDIQNAQDDQSNLKTISQKFVADKKDLVLAIATPSAQAIAMEAKDTTMPILITAVTDPADAKLVASNEKPGGNITGTSDLTPVKEQLELLVKIVPTAKKVAIMYSSKESNSEFQAKLAKEAAESLGLTTEYKTVASVNDIAAIAESIVGEFDAIYVPTDNVIASAMANLSKITDENKIPLIVGEVGMTEGGALASVSIDYYQLGYKTGEMAVDILEGKSKPADMPIEYAPNPTIIFNKTTFDRIGIEMPKDLADTATIIE